MHDFRTLFIAAASHRATRVLSYKYMSVTAMLPCIDMIDVIKNTHLQRVIYPTEIFSSIGIDNG